MIYALMLESNVAKNCGMEDELLQKFSGINQHSLFNSAASF